jgi:hypothetical protein
VHFKTDFALLRFSFISSHPITALALNLVHFPIQSQLQLSSSILMFIIFPERFAYVSERVMFHVPSILPSILVAVL